MARTFSGSGAQTASVLVKTIPAEQRLPLVQSLTASLRTTFDTPTASLLLELVSSQTDEQAKEELLKVLTTQIEDGAPSVVASLLLQSLELARDLLDSAATRLSQLALNSDGCIVPGFAANVDPNRSISREAGTPSFESAIQWLRFAKSLEPIGLPSQANERLLHSALLLLGAIDQATALAARDLAFSLISGGGLSEKSAKLISKTTNALLRSHLPHHQTLGYYLWLRVLIASDQSQWQAFDITALEYWAPIHAGLRHGDTERRKLCLEILKRSVALAIERGHTGGVSNSGKGSDAAISSQYVRYCTIFETVVLARYTNLVVECKRDLDLLASPASMVKAKWLYTLLATALDTKTQDQNRRFMGNWMLETDLNTAQDADGFLTLLGEQYLPWVTEGHLFVASIEQRGLQLGCSHGDRLADFIHRIMRQHAADQTALGKLLDTILQFMIRRQNSLFAYAVVHLLRGIGRAFAGIDTLCLKPTQTEMLLSVCSWKALPEVARDVAVMQCRKIYELSYERTEGKHAIGISSLAQSQLAGMKADAALSAGLSGLEDGQAQLPQPSQRDVAIAAAVKKCDSIAAGTSSATHRSSSELRDLLEDIWSDLEYLEYPRDLLMKIPTILFNNTVIKAALEEDSEASTGVGAFLLATLPRMLDLAQRRSFLLAQLVPGLREILLSTPEAADLFDIEECILQIARDPPEASIDLRIEYATVPLLSEVIADENDGMTKYFGPGEGFGFAAYFDIISRLGSTRSDLIESVLKVLLTRWKRQKTPVPVMSPWKTTLQLQAMLLCLEQYTPLAEPHALEATLNDLYHILSIEPLPRYRYLLEWMIVRVQIRHPELRPQTLKLLSTKDHHSNPKFLASLMKIGLMLATTKDAAEDFAVELASLFIGLSASSKIVIRHEAQWSFPSLTDQAREHKWASITQNSAYVALDDYIRSLPRFGDPPPERAMSKLDPSSDSTLTHLAEGAWTGLDNTRPPFARHCDFVKLYEKDRATNTQHWPPPCLDLGCPTTTASPPPAPTPAPPPKPSSSDPSPPPHGEPTALQTKGTAYLKTSTLTSPSPTPHHQNLILIASLIENPHNLGGLSRCSEIFGASALYLSNPRVTSEKDFTTVAVSSHNHLPVLPLPVADLTSFLRSKKSEGYTVVGVEQTDRSVLLGTKGCVLPANCVLVLGSEREGMPALVLGECDLLVEIPQVGVTRSLNVQTAAAVVLFEFGRQRKAALEKGA